MRRLQLTLTAVLAVLALQTQAAGTVDYRWWFDGESAAAGSGHSAAGAWQMQVDASALREGVHSIHVQVADADGVAGTPVTRYFVKTPSAQAQLVAYWVDDSSTPLHTSTVTNGLVMLDMNDLPNGFHTLHVQAVGERSSQPKTYAFIKEATLAQVKSLMLTTWIDGELHGQETLPTNGGLASWEVDMNSLAQGLHLLQMQVMTDNGIISRMLQAYFYRAPNRAEMENVEFYYCIDGNGEWVKAGKPSNGTFQLDIDVNSLEPGIHKLTCIFTDGYGTDTQLMTHKFVIPPVGDANADGVVDIDDVNIIINIILDLDDAARYEGRADPTKNGVVDIDDLNMCINIIIMLHKD